MKEVRKKLKLSQAEMAEKLRITQPYYSAMERGVKNIPTYIIDSLIKEIGISPNWFFNSIGTMFHSIHPIPALNQQLNIDANYFIDYGKNQKEILIGKLRNENELYINLYETLQALERNIVDKLTPITKDYLHIDNPEDISFIVNKDQNGNVGIMGSDPNFENRTLQLIRRLFPHASQIEAVNEAIEKFLQNIKSIGIDNKYYL